MQRAADERNYRWPTTSKVYPDIKTDKQYNTSRDTEPPGRSFLKIGYPHYNDFCCTSLQASPPAKLKKSTSTGSLNTSRQRLLPCNSHPVRTLSLLDVYHRAGHRVQEPHKILDEPLLAAIEDGS